MTDATEPRLALGAMTGTSLDGIDAALVATRGRGAALTAHVVATRSAPLGPLGAELRRAAGGEPMAAADFARLALELGNLHAEVLGALADAAPSPPVLCAVHGQTVHHAPPLSWQLLNPAPIARRLRCPVVCDLRQADLAAGGQGAPITPLADWVLFRAARARAIVNLGGFCNVTVLPAADGAANDIRAFDACPCNHVLDAIARRCLGRPYDDGGALAQRGACDDALARELESVLPGVPGVAARSLGTGDEATGALERYAALLTPEDLAATACDAIARRIGRLLAGTGVHDVMVAGGGARNAALFRAIERHVASRVIGSDVVGVPVEFREAVAMAVLGALAADGLPITLPAVTGCPEPAPCAGTWCAPIGAVAFVIASDAT